MLIFLNGTCKEIYFYLSYQRSVFANWCLLLEVGYISIVCHYSFLWQRCFNCVAVVFVINENCVLHKITKIADNKWTNKMRPCCSACCFGTNVINLLSHNYVTSQSTFCSGGSFHLLNMLWWTKCDIVMQFIIDKRFNQFLLGGWG